MGFALCNEQTELTRFFFLFACDFAPGWCRVLPLNDAKKLDLEKDRMNNRDWEICDCTIKNMDMEAATKYRFCHHGVYSRVFESYHMIQGRNRLELVPTM